MSDAEQPSIPAPANAVKARCAHKKKFGFVAFVALLILIAAGWYFCPMILKTRNPPEQNTAQMDQKIAALEQQMAALNSRIDEMNTHMTTTAAGANADPAAMARMQSDVSTLSTAMNGIEAEVKRTGAAAAQRQQAEQSSMAAAIAFIQLQSAAEAGRGFSAELAAVKGAAPEDVRFREILARLEPYAKGAPKLDALREEFISLEPSISIAVSRSTAQNWWGRLMSEMKGLISIRPLHGGGAMDYCTAAEDALSSGDLSAALAAVGSLPPEAQDTLKNWRAKAEARATVDAGLHDLSDRLTAMATAAAPNAQAEP